MYMARYTKRSEREVSSLNVDEPQTNHDVNNYIIRTAFDGRRYCCTLFADPTINVPRSFREQKYARQMTIANTAQNDFGVSSGLRFLGKNKTGA